jgi:hypothetical protein
MKLEVRNMWSDKNFLGISSVIIADTNTTYVTTTHC